MLNSKQDQASFDSALKKDTQFLNDVELKLYNATALSVTYLPSELHPIPPVMSWNFEEWSDDRTLVIQLNFDKPDIVSMESELDQVQVQFNDPLIFEAKDGTLVEKSKTIQETISPQIAQGAFADAAISATEVAKDSMVAVGASSFSFGFLMKFSLSHLWSMINALQLAVNLPLFKFQFPGLANALYRTLFNLTSFNVVSIEEQVEDFYGLDHDE